MNNILILACAIVVSLCAPAPQVPYGYGNPYGSYFQPEETEVENEFGEGLGPRPNPPIPIPGTSGMGAVAVPRAGVGAGVGGGYQAAYEPPDFEDIYNYQLMNRQAGGQGAAGTPPYGMPPLTQADFTKFDANNDGAIDYNDLFQATRYAEDKEEVFNTFRGSDINFDGRISRNEFFTFPLEWQRLVLENNYYEQLYSRFYPQPQPPPRPPTPTQIPRSPIHGQTQGRGRYQSQPSGQSPTIYSGTSASQPFQTQGYDVYPTEPVYNDTMPVDGNYTDISTGNETFFYDYGNTTTYGNDTVGYDGYPIVDMGNGADQQTGMGPDTTDTGAGSSLAVETSAAARTELGMDAAAANANKPAIGTVGAQPTLIQPASEIGVATAPQKQPMGQPQSGAVAPKQPVIQPKQTGISHPHKMGGAGAGKPTYPQIQRPASQQYPQQPPRQPHRQPHQQHRQPQQPQRPPQQPPQRPPQQPQQPQYNPYQYPFIDPEDYAEYLTYKQFYPNMLGGQAGQQGGQQPYPGQYGSLMDEDGGGMSIEKIAKFQAYDRLFGQGQGQGMAQQGTPQGGSYNPYGQPEPAYNPYANAYNPYSQSNPNLYPPNFD